MASPAQHFRLLDLPLEIRSIILDFVFSDVHWAHRTVPEHRLKLNFWDDRLRYIYSKTGGFDIFVHQPDAVYAGLRFCNKQISWEIRQLVRFKRRNGAGEEKRWLDIYIDQEAEKLLVTWRGPAWQRCLPTAPLTLQVRFRQSDKELAAPGKIAMFWALWLIFWAVTVSGFHFDPDYKIEDKLYERQDFQVEFFHEDNRIELGGDGPPYDDALTQRCHEFTSFLIATNFTSGPRGFEYMDYSSVGGYLNVKVDTGC